MADPAKGYRLPHRRRPPGGAMEERSHPSSGTSWKERGLPLPLMISPLRWLKSANNAAEGCQESPEGSRGSLRAAGADSGARTPPLILPFLLCHLRHLGQTPAAENLAWRKAASMPSRERLAWRQETHRGERMLIHQSAHGQKQTSLPF